MSTLACLPGAACARRITQPSRVARVLSWWHERESRRDATRGAGLAEAERAELIFDLLDSLDDRPIESDQMELDSVWTDETARRANQIDSGELATDSWDDVMDKVVESRRVR